MRLSQKAADRGKYPCAIKIGVKCDSHVCCNVPEDLQKGLASLALSKSFVITTLTSKD